MRKRAALLVLGLLLVLTGGWASAATPREVVRANRAVATQMAKRLLRDVVLPQGTTGVSKRPAGAERQLDRPVMFLFFAAQVDRARLWITHASTSSVIASFQAHMPRQARSLGSGYFGASKFAAYEWPVAGHGVIGQRQLVLEAVPLHDGRVGVRADAEVQYFAPRLRTQAIPPAARVLRITIRSGDRGSKKLMSLTVNKRAQVRGIARIVDSLPFEGSPFGGAIACPAIPIGPNVTFRFSTTVRGRALASVHELADTPVDGGVCDAASLFVRGHQEPGLLGGGRLLRDAGRILGVKLTRAPER